jgi:molybdopterin biosynthesis enzyme
MCLPFYPGRSGPAGFLFDLHSARGVADFLLVRLRHKQHHDDADPAQQQSEQVTQPTSAFVAAYHPRNAYGHNPEDEDEQNFPR